MGLGLGWPTIEKLPDDLEDRWPFFLSSGGTLDVPERGLGSSSEKGLGAGGRLCVARGSGFAFSTVTFSRASRPGLESGRRIFRGDCEGDTKDSALFILSLASFKSRVGRSFSCF